MLEILKEGTLIPNAAHSLLYAVSYSCEASTAKTRGNAHGVFTLYLGKETCTKKSTSYEFLCVEGLTHNWRPNQILSIEPGVKTHPRNIVMGI